MERRQKGYLFVEVMIGLAVFTLFAGAVAQTFTAGLRLFQEETDPNDAIMAMTLINRIKERNIPATDGAEVTIEMPLTYQGGGQNETWKMVATRKKLIDLFNPDNAPSGTKGLCYLEAKITRTAGRKTEEKGTYPIFRYSKS